MEPPRPKGKPLADTGALMATDAPQPVMISVVIPAYNGEDCLSRCLQAITAGDYRRFECIVVDDSSTDNSRAIAAQFPVRLVNLSGGPFGPAYARNRGAELAQGEILLFVDADVAVHADTLPKVAETFARHPDIDAVFGSYDDSPEAPEFLSRYKNLFHHFVHQHAREEAVTFWSGCGAVRREVFFLLGGFDENRHVIEDIELGYRMRAAGRKIVVNKAIQVKHLKRWTLRGMIQSDVLDRGIPWTMLILRERAVPNDLNLRVSQRVSALLFAAAVLYLSFLAFFHAIVILPLLGGLFILLAGNWTEEAPHFQLSRTAKMLTYVLTGTIVGLALYSGVLWVLPFLVFPLVGVLGDRWLPRFSVLFRRAFFGAMVLGLSVGVAFLLLSISLGLAAPLLLMVFLIMLLNYRFYAFFARKRGLIFTLAVIPFHLFYYFYSVIAFLVGAGLYVRTKRGVRTSMPNQAAEAMADIPSTREPSRP